jgi:putative transposase
VGAAKTVAAAQGAWICFEDEAGQNMRPPVARTWAQRGQTPTVSVSGKGSGRISIAGLVCIRPHHRGRLMFRTIVHRGRRGERKSFADSDYIHLLDAAHRQLRAPLVVVWDNLNTHVSLKMRAMIDARDWLMVIRLPAFAPDLNPAEGVWSNRKSDSATSAPAPSMTCTGSSATGSNASSTDPNSSTDPRPGRPHPRRRFLNLAI